MRRKQWPRHGGLGLGLGVGGGGVGYLLNDDFSLSPDVAAGSLNGTTCVPGPSVPIRTVAGNCSINSGYLVLPASSATDGNPGLHEGGPGLYDGGLSSDLGRMVLIKFKGDGNPLWVAVGCDINTASHLSLTALDIQNNVLYTNLAASPNTGIAYATMDPSEDIIIAIASGGSLASAYFFIKSSVTFPTYWHFLTFRYNQASTTLWPAINKQIANTYLNTTYCRFIKSPTQLWLPKPIISDKFNYAIWGTTDGKAHSPNTGIAAGGGGLAWTADVGVWEINASTRSKINTLVGGQAITTIDAYDPNIFLNCAQIYKGATGAYGYVGLVARYYDPSNCLRFRWHTDALGDTYIYLDEIVGGAPNNLMTELVTYGNPSSVQLILNNNTAKVLWSGGGITTLYGPYTINAALANYTKVGLYGTATSASNGHNYLTTWHDGSNYNYGDIFDKFCH